MWAGLARLPHGSATAKCGRGGPGRRGKGAARAWPGGWFRRPSSAAHARTERCGRAGSGAALAQAPNVPRTSRGRGLPSDRSPFALFSARAGVTRPRNQDVASQAGADRLERARLGVPVSGQNTCPALGMASARGRNAPSRRAALRPALSFSLAKSCPTRPARPSPDARATRLLDPRNGCGPPPHRLRSVSALSVRLSPRLTPPPSSRRPWPSPLRPGRTLPPSRTRPARPANGVRPHDDAFVADPAHVRAPVRRFPRSDGIRAARAGR